MRSSLRPKRIFLTIENGLCDDHAVKIRRMEKLANHHIVSDVIARVVRRYFKWLDAHIGLEGDRVPRPIGVPRSRPWISILTLFYHSSNLRVIVSKSAKNSNKQYGPGRGNAWGDDRD